MISNVVDKDKIIKQHLKKQRENMNMEKLMDMYQNIKDEIENRLAEFKNNFHKDDTHILYELIFCLLTPQSKAKVCWKCVEEMMMKDIIHNVSHDEILSCLKGVRFHNNKTRYILEAIDKFAENGKIVIKDKLKSFDTPFAMREFLVREIKGMGMKEASHFLRNIGLGDELAILDRHILKNLKKYNVIKEVPKTLSKKKYIEIEEKMKDFAKKINIPMDHLDLLFWYLETKEIFK